MHLITPIFNLEKIAFASIIYAGKNALIICESKLMQIQLKQ